MISYHQFPSSYHITTSHHHITSPYHIMMPCHRIISWYHIVISHPCIIISHREITSYHNTTSWYHIIMSYHIISSHHIMISYHHVTTSHHSTGHNFAKIIQRPKIGRHERCWANVGQLLHIISISIQWNGSQTSKINNKIAFKNIIRVRGSPDRDISSLHALVDGAGQVWRILPPPP